MATVRLATADDIPSLLPLIEGMFAHEAITFRIDSVRAALARLIGDPALGAVLVACDETGDVVGYGIATMGYDLEFAGVDAFITELFVHPEHRRRGTGRRLLTGIIDEFRRRSAGAVHLMVRPENHAARRLYEAYGFETVPRIMMSKEL